MIGISSVKMFETFQSFNGSLKFEL